MKNVEVNEMHVHCLHEQDWGTVFNEIKGFSKHLDSQTELIKAIQLSVNVITQYMYGLQAITLNKKENENFLFQKEQSNHLKKEYKLHWTVFAVASIISLSGIFITYMIEFGGK